MYFKTTPIIILTLLLISCGSDTPHPTGTTPTFTHEVCLRYTPVKNQGRSPLCWAYAMLATIETEHITMGDSVNLSPLYTARCLLSEEARRCFFGGGTSSKASLRATAPLLLRLLSEYGTMPYDTYNAPSLNINAITRRIERAATQSHTLADADRRTERLLDEQMGYLPKHVYMLGAEYTFLEFAHSVCMNDEYVALTSFTHHPFGEAFALEVPDNRSGEMFINLPIDDLMQRITKSLRAGHPVCWEGDISEPGFSFERGTATLPTTQPCTQEERQQEFETRCTTDDHCMCLIGIAHDKKGHPYFIAKNSWGTDNPYGGLMYLSFDYVKMKTIAVVMKRLLI